jgi:hypothetical protein
MTNKKFPTIDGHFWLERGGKKVDIEFEEYDYVRKFHKLTDGMVYKEADAMTQTIMIKMFEKCVNKISMKFNLDNFQKFSKEMGVGAKMNCCFQNCMLAYEDGDLIRFGSMGWNKRDGSGVWWEYGGEDWEGVKAFLK